MTVTSPKEQLLPRPKHSESSREIRSRDQMDKHGPACDTPYLEKIFFRTYAAEGCCDERETQAWGREMPCKGRNLKLVSEPA